jgi:DNA-binding MarR family transcriptional regulator
LTEIPAAVHNCPSTETLLWSAKTAGSLQLSEDEKTLERIFRTLGALYRLRELELNRLGLSLLEAAVLYFVKTSSYPLTCAQISRMIHRPPHTVSVLLNRLEKRGLAIRSRDPDRKNWVRVSLTERGEAILHRQLSESESRNITARLSREDLAVLNTVLRQLHDAATELTQQIKPTPYDEVAF